MIKHLACIMDGNRRWAQQKNLQPWYGHKEGVDAAFRVINFCLSRNIEYLSLFMFAIQNFKRSAQEINYIFDMFATNAQEVVAMFIKHDVRVQWIGDRSLFPESLQALCQEIEERTAHAQKLKLQLLFCYGGQEEIVAATKAIAQDVKAGIITPDAISPDLFKTYLWSGAIIHPDLIIRTGKVHRLSNFLLYQAAYSELYFVDCLWPEISEDYLQQAVDYFNNCQRNFGI